MKVLVYFFTDRNGPTHTTVFTERTEGRVTGYVTYTGNERRRFRSYRGVLSSLPPLDFLTTRSEEWTI